MDVGGVEIIGFDQASKTDKSYNVNGCRPNHATGARFPDVAVTPLQYVD